MCGGGGGGLGTYQKQRSQVFSEITKWNFVDRSYNKAAIKHRFLIKVRYNPLIFDDK